MKTDHFFIRFPFQAEEIVATEDDTFHSTVAQTTTTTTDDDDFDDDDDDFDDDDEDVDVDVDGDDEDGVVSELVCTILMLRILKFQ